MDANSREAQISFRRLAVSECAPLLAWHSIGTLTEPTAKTVRASVRDERIRLKILHTANAELSDESLSPVVSLDMGSVSNVKVQVWGGSRELPAVGVKLDAEGDGQI